MLPVMLGKKTKAQISVHHLPSKNDSPRYTPVRIKQVDEQKYELGPFMAILTSDGGASFNGNHQNFADIIRMGRMMGITVFVLTPRGLSSNDAKVEGYLLDHRSSKLRWIKTKLPFPNVVYNRIPSRKSESRSEVQEAIRKLQKTPGVHFFNPHFFDKWTLYTQLSSVGGVSSIIPDTMRLDQNAFQIMGNKYPTLYLKSINGKAGIGMMRISKLKKGYELIHQGTREKKKYHVSDLPALWSLVQSLCKKTPYLLQQGISLAQYRGRPFDVRMLIQKNGQGEWEVTGTGIRVAGETSISTHVPMGGRIENINQVFKEVFGSGANEKIKQVKEIGLTLAQAIESKQQSSLGELSIDLGVEPNGRMWFFEANAKPMKFDEPEIRTRSLRRLIQYCLYLSGYPQVVAGVGS
jgi:hypothetical protein